jgi:hypothetical protein
MGLFLIMLVLVPFNKNSTVLVATIVDGLRKREEGVKESVEWVAGSPLGFLCGIFLRGKSRRV